MRVSGTTSPNNAGNGFTMFRPTLLILPGYHGFCDLRLRSWGGKNRASTAGAGSSFSQYALDEMPISEMFLLAKIKLKAGGL